MRITEHLKQGCGMSWVPSYCEVHERQYYKKDPLVVNFTALSCIKFFLDIRTEPHVPIGAHQDSGQIKMSIMTVTFKVSLPTYKQKQLMKITNWGSSLKKVARPLCGQFGSTMPWGIRSWLNNLSRLLFIMTSSRIYTTVCWIGLHKGEYYNSSPKEFWTNYLIIPTYGYKYNYHFYFSIKD